jgi:hypothetical protein
MVTGGAHHAAWAYVLWPRAPIHGSLSTVATWRVSSGEPFRVWFGSAVEHDRPCLSGKIGLSGRASRFSLE